MIFKNVMPDFQFRSQFNMAAFTTTASALKLARVYLGTMFKNALGYSCIVLQLNAIDIA
jgi:hypothetical protein